MTLYRHPQDFASDFALELPRDDLSPPGPMKHVLLTGATGFLGRYTLLELLASTASHVTCLVRGGSVEAAGAKLLRALRRAGWTADELPDRVSIVLGDVARSHLGMSTADYRRLTREVDSVLHGAAQIAWSLPYPKLRETNAWGTREVARFCFANRLKRLVFISSIATRFSPAAPGTIDENTDMRPFVHTMPLAYGQSKCVAEALVEHLAELGAPVSILRPGLISGHSRTGAMNDDDFVARMLVCVVNERCAPDLDLLMDCVAVDDVARISVANLLEDPDRVSNAQSRVRRLHLLSPDAPSWTELVASVNLFCAGVRLDPWERWLSHINARARNLRHVLNPLRPFLLGRLPWDTTVRTPEMYCSTWQQRVDSRESRRWISQRALPLAAMDGPLLERSLAYLASKGRIELIRRFGTAGARPPGGRHAEGMGLSSLAGWLAAKAPLYGAPGQRALVARESADGGLASRVASWRYGSQFRNSVLELVRTPSRGKRRPATSSVFIKHAPGQDTVNLLGAALGDLESPELGALLGRHMALLDFDQPALRELAAYSHEGPAALCGHAPDLLAGERFDGSGVVRLALQCLPRRALIPEAGWTEPWHAARAQPILDAMTSWQSLPASRAAHPLFEAPDESTLVAARDLWPALGAVVRQTIERLATPRGRGETGPVHALPGHALRAYLAALLLRVDQHLRAYRALPTTFIHNDFNPRNLAILARRAGGCGPRVVAFDWQLCCHGPPVRDLVDFLCFALDRDRAATELPSWLEGHRRTLEKAHGTQWPRDQWLVGFDLALDDWLLRRLPLYALYHRVRPQAFLPEVIQNWWAMREASEQLHRAIPSQVAGARGPRPLPRREEALNAEPDCRRAA